MLWPLYLVPPGGHRDGRQGPDDDPVFGGLPPRAMGMIVFLISTGVLFVAGLAAFIIAVRLPATRWPPTNLPALPQTLWLSTGILLVSGATMQTALSAARRSRGLLLRVAITATTALAAAFLGCQWLSWVRYVRAGVPINAPDLFVFGFYVLTALHAVHVLGGLVPLVWVTVKSYRGRYAAGRHHGVWYCAMYWHFLGVVWIVLFAVLFVAI
ncbi:Cytochrome c oxidase subunit 3 [Phycisphaerae bacterium RAS1]|nr:Cytochrome c oxidase subunit 3 [Phycisphaerae bacterium RAS1]